MKFHCKPRSSHWRLSQQRRRERRRKESRQRLTKPKSLLTLLKHLNHLMMRQKLLPRGEEGLQKLQLRSQKKKPSLLLLGATVVNPGTAMMMRSTLKTHWSKASLMHCPVIMRLTMMTSCPLTLTRTDKTMKMPMKVKIKDLLGCASISRAFSDCTPID